MAVELIEQYYQENSVYKALVICDDEATAIQLGFDMTAKDYILSTILDDDIVDERPRFMQILREWHTDMTRVLVISVYVAMNLSELLKLHVLPHQNLVVFCNIDHNISHKLVNWMDQCQASGFLGEVNLLSI